MPVKSLKTEIIDKRPNAKPQANARIKNVDGSTYTDLGSTAYDVTNSSNADTQKISETTGYFGKTIEELSE
tara:strand:+ start:622 stop:834 length:213 start_codon:yes stop_codon:yes gene_type:complete